MGEPSPRAKLAQATAMVEVGLLDRAWVILRELVEVEDNGAAPHVLAAEMFLRRGWHPQARKSVQAGMKFEPDNKKLAALWDQASEPSTELDETDLDREAVTTESLIRYAEHFLAVGAFVRARSVLERVRRQTTHHPRCEELIWALTEDFSMQETLGEVADRMQPELAPLSYDETDHTESASRDDLANDDHQAASFPQLFRTVEPATEAWSPPEEDEVTKVTSLKALNHLPPVAENTSTGEDTQIMRVVRKDGEILAETNEVSDAAPLNLANYEDDVTDVGPEEEDASLVVRRHVQSSGGPARPSGVHLETDLEAMASKAHGDGEAWARPEPAASKPKVRSSAMATMKPNRANRQSSEETLEVPRAVPLDARPSPPAMGPTWPWWVAAIALLTALSFVMMVLLALVAAFT